MPYNDNFFSPLMQSDTLKNDEMPKTGCSTEQATRSRSPTVRDEQLPEDAQKKLEKHGDSELDPQTLIVDWNGPDDPSNPLNWPIRQKWAATVIVSLFALISPMSSSMSAPAADKIAQEFHITSNAMVAMTTSIFVLGYAVGPLVLGPLSELYGRSRVLQLSNLFYLVWNLACGFSQNTGQLIAFRLLAGMGGSAPMAVGGGVLADIWKSEDRGKAIAIYSLTPLWGPCVGPLCGAWISQLTTWRWVYWSTTIFDAFLQIAAIFCLRETFPPLLLERKANAIRKGRDPEKGRFTKVVTVYDKDGSRSWKQIFWRAMLRPFALLALEPIVQLVAIYLAFLYGILYLALTSIPLIFSKVYQQPGGIGGLHYLALGVGLSSAAQANSYLLDRIYVNLKEKNNGIGQPEFRLPCSFVGVTLIPAGLLIYGWASQAHVHWIVTDLGLALLGAGINSVYQSMQTYVIDAFTLYSASALGAIAFLRSLAGFGFPLFAPTMYRALGYGKANTILACFGIILGWPGPWIFWKYGKRIRGLSRYARKL